MQSQQMPQMAGMNANMNGAGPLNGTPMMGNLQRPGMPLQQQHRNPDDARVQLNTYIYDYFIRNKHHSLAAKMLESNIELKTKKRENGSPSGRNVNGVDAMKTEMDDLPEPVLPENAQAAQNSFLMDWWESFWDIFAAARNGSASVQSKQYIHHTRNLGHIHNEQRTNRMLMANNAMGAQYNMIRGMPNGVAANANDLKRAAAMNSRPNGPNNNAMANMQMKSQQMMAAQMQRDGSQMDMNGQRPHSPGSNENAPSPNKRPRVEGGMNAANMPGNAFNDFAAQGGNLQQQKSIEGMNSGVQGSPMNHQGLEGQHEVYTGNQPRPGMAPGGPQQQGNHALQDYQMQLMLLEQQNKKRLLMARQEQDNISTAPHGQPSVGPPGFAPAMSPQGSRSGPSPNPNDQMKRGTPKLNQPGLPGSPMPDAAMQQRSSPAPGGFPIDPSQMPPGMPPQFGYPQMGQTPMMRPPSSHPGGFNPQQMTPQQMEALSRNGGIPNGGGWRGPPQGMMQGQAQQMGGPMGNPQRGGMPPPPAPVGEQPRAQEPSPSQSTAAPPTPSQTNKANPKKKQTKDNKKPAKAKGATGSTPAAPNEEPPTPATPITPIHAQSFQNGKQQPSQPAQPQPPAAPSQQSVMDNGNGPFGNIGDETNFDIGSFALTDDAGGLGDFDFDTFLHVNDDAGFGALGTDFDFGTVEASGEV